MESLNFNELDLSKELQKAITDMGFEEATPIQALSIPHILEGKDVIGQAQTGTGKTCAFGIPAIEMLSDDSENVEILVLCPTRELAIQSAEELKKVSKYKKGVRVLPIYGGQPIDRQIIALKKKPQIIIGTPGRIMDHMRRKTLKLANLKMIILDEADEMLNMGFREDIDTILEKVPEQRQTILFSATMAKEIMDLTTKYLKDPVHVKATHKELTVPSIEQYYIETNERSKLEILSRLIDSNNVKLGLVFCNTKKRVDELAMHLQSRGYSVEALHGDMRQVQRDKVMNRFRKGNLDILIATDVAARGIDVDNIEAVFNYDLPNDEEYYVHRIGRTGRAGKKGVAYSFIVGREIYKLRDIQRYTKSSIAPIKPPSAADLEENKASALLEEVKKLIAHGGLSQYVGYIEKYIEDSNSVNISVEYINSIDIAAALLKLSTGVRDAGEEPEYFESSNLDKLDRPKRNIGRSTGGRSSYGSGYGNSSGYGRNNTRSSGGRYSDNRNPETRSSEQRSDQRNNNSRSGEQRNNEGRSGDLRNNDSRSGEQRNYDNRGGEQRSNEGRYNNKKRANGSSQGMGDYNKSNYGNKLKKPLPPNE